MASTDYAKRPPEAQQHRAHPVGPASDRIHGLQWAAVTPVTVSSRLTRSNAHRGQYPMTTIWLLLLVFAIALIGVFEFMDS